MHSHVAWILPATMGTLGRKAPRWIIGYSFYSVYLYFKMPFSVAYKKVTNKFANEIGIGIHIHTNFRPKYVFQTVHFSWRVSYVSKHKDTCLV